MINLSQASKKEIDVVLNDCGWRQTKQRVTLLKTIFDGFDKHFCVNAIEQTLKDHGSFFSYTTLFENLTLATTILSAICFEILAAISYGEVSKETPSLSEPSGMVILIG